MPRRPGTELAGLPFPLPTGAIPDLESTMKTHSFTVATAAAAFLAASTMATFAQTGTGGGGGGGTGTKSTTTTTSTTAPSTTAPKTTSTTTQKTKQVDCPGHAENSKGMAKVKNPNCR